MKTKFNKESRNLMIALLLGDGTISNNNVYKLSHSYKQKEYLEWKIKILNEHGVRNNGLKSYISSCGYNKGQEVYYTQLRMVPFIKVLRRVMYKNGDKKFNRKILNRLNPLGIAIWYMDDGCINFRRVKGRTCGFYIRISTCLPKDEALGIINFFKEEWDINFYLFHEGRKDDSFSLCCGTKEGIKFIDLVKPYIEQIPSMRYKVTYDLSLRVRPL